MKARVARRKVVIDIVEGLVVDVDLEDLEVLLFEKAGEDLIVLILWCFVVGDGVMEQRQTENPQDFIPCKRAI